MCIDLQTVTGIMMKAESKQLRVQSCTCLWRLQPPESKLERWHFAHRRESPCFALHGGGTYATPSLYSTSPSRHTIYRGDNTPNTLDLIFTNESGMLDSLKYLAPIGKSHHSSLKMDFCCYTKASNTSKDRHTFTTREITTECAK